MNDGEGGLTSRTSAGLFHRTIRLVVIVGAVLVVATVGFFTWLVHVVPPDKEENNQVDTRPAALRAAQLAAVYMDSATVAKRPYPTVQQMRAEHADFEGMDVTVLSSDSRRRTYCITALTVADHLILRDEPIRYYVHRPAGAPLEPLPPATTTPCT